LLGIPVSTTQTIAGSIVGVGIVTNASGIQWKVAMRIVGAWFMTIPFAGITAALFFYLFKLLHPGF
jgi:PiT family inorganic phosphate transporter